MPRSRDIWLTVRRATGAPAPASAADSAVVAQRTRRVFRGHHPRQCLAQRRCRGALASDRLAEQRTQPPGAARRIDRRAGHARLIVLWFSPSACATSAMVIGCKAPTPVVQCRRLPRQDLARDLQQGRIAACHQPDQDRASARPGPRSSASASVGRAEPFSDTSQPAGALARHQIRLADRRGAGAETRARLRVQPPQAARSRPHLDFRVIAQSAAMLIGPPPPPPAAAGPAPRGPAGPASLLRRPAAPGIPPDRGRNSPVGSIRCSRRQDRLGNAPAEPPPLARCRPAAGPASPTAPAPRPRPARHLPFAPQSGAGLPPPQRHAPSRPGDRCVRQALHRHPDAIRAKGPCPARRPLGRGRRARSPVAGSLPPLPPETGSGPTASLPQTAGSMQQAPHSATSAAFALIGDPVAVGHRGKATAPPGPAQRRDKPALSPFRAQGALWLRA